MPRIHITAIILISYILAGLMVLTGCDKDTQAPQCINQGIQIMPGDVQLQRQDDAQVSLVIDPFDLGFVGAETQRAFNGDFLDPFTWSQSEPCVIDSAASGGGFRVELLSVYR